MVGATTAPTLFRQSADALLTQLQGVPNVYLSVVAPTPRRVACRALYV